MSKNIIAQKSKDLIKFTLKHYNFKDKLVLVIYVLMSFIGKGIFFIKPIFDVADDNLARIIVETHYLNFPMVFKVIKKRYGELLLVDTIRSLESLAIALVLFGLPFLVISLTPNPAIEQTPGHFIIYGLAVLTLIISYLIGVKYWAVPHIILANSNLTGSDGMLMSKLSKKQYGGKVFLARLPYYLMVILFIGLFVGTILIIQSITNYDNVLIVSVFSDIVPLILSLLWLVIYRIYISKCVKSYLIYQEVIKISKPIVAKQVSGDKLDYVPLFDDGEIDASILNQKGGK